MERRWQESVNMKMDQKKLPTLQNEGGKKEHSLQDLWDNIKRTKYMYLQPQNERKERIRQKKKLKKLQLKFLKFDERYKFIGLKLKKLLVGQIKENHTFHSLKPKTENLESTQLKTKNTIQGTMI